MSIVPHNFNYFGAFALLLRAERIGTTAVDMPWDMRVDEACDYLEALVHFVTQGTDAVLRQAFPRQMVVQILGGDPFFYLDDLDRMLEVVKRFQFQCEVSTTGLWVKSEEHICETLSRLDGKVHALFLDTSRALLDRIGLENLEALIVEARRRGLGLKIRCGVADDSPLPVELLRLEIMNADTSITEVIPMQHSSHTVDSLSSRAPPLRRRCAESFAFFVMPGGEVFPCSRGAGLPGLRLGSLRTESISDILSHVRPQKALRHLREYGPYSLYDTLRHGPASSRLSPAYVDACHFHRHALSDPELSDAAQDEAVFAQQSRSPSHLMGIPIRRG